MITSRSFVKKLDKCERTLVRRLKAYLKDSSADNVHDLRTAARRILAAFHLLPREVRNKKKLRKLVANHNKLLKLNARVRDTDIILSKLSKHRQSGVYSRLAKNLERSRKSGLKRARGLASEIEENPLPSIKRRELSDLRLQTRFLKVVGALDSRIRARLPVVLADPLGIEALHLLREDSRWLRYTLELADTPKAILVSALRAWQNALGAVRDCDVLIEYLQTQEDLPEIQALLETEAIERSRSYQKFCSVAGKRPSFTALD